MPRGASASPSATTTTPPACTWTGSVPSAVSSIPTSSAVVPAVWSVPVSSAVVPAVWSVPISSADVRPAVARRTSEPSSAVSHTDAATAPRWVTAVSTRASATPCVPTPRDTAAVAACSARSWSVDRSAAARAASSSRSYRERSVARESATSTLRPPSAPVCTTADISTGRRPSGPRKLDRDLVDPALHVQQRGQVRLPVDAAADGEQVAQARALRGATDPLDEHPVGVEDRAVTVQPQERDRCDVPGLATGHGPGTR